MCEEYLKYRNGDKDVMQMLCLHNSIDQWAMENSVCCYGHVLWRVDGKQYQLLWTCVVEGGW